MKSVLEKAIEMHVASWYLEEERSLGRQPTFQVISGTVREQSRNPPVYWFLKNEITYENHANARSNRTPSWHVEGFYTHGFPTLNAAKKWVTANRQVK